MLPRPSRVTSPADFRRILRRGRKVGRRHLVVHALAGGGTCSRAGLVVGKGVGGAVVRHRVSRRLRHLLADRLDALPAGTLVVVRAQAPAAAASSADLGHDLDAALRRLVPGGPAPDPAGPATAARGTGTTDAVRGGPR